MFDIKKKRLNLDIARGKCDGCGRCVAVCPHEAVMMSCEKEGIKAVLLWPENCTSCKRCSAVCPKDAISFSEAKVFKEALVW